MKAIIQEKLYQRAKNTFKNSTINFISSSKRDEEDLLNKLKKHQTKCIVIDSRPFSKRFFSSLPQRILIARFGTGYNNIPIDLCLKKNILVANTPSILKNSVTEHVLALMLSLARNILHSHQNIISGHWDRIEGIELKDKTIGIIGFGNIGKHLSKVVKQALNMKVIVYTKTPPKDAKQIKWVDFFYNNLEDCLSNSDIVSIHVPLTTQTTHMINKITLKKMKKKAFLINTSRGNVIDEKALFYFLKEKKIAAAALDVFKTEPYSSKKEIDFRTLPNVILTPHISAHTACANEKMAQKTIENIQAFYKNDFTNLSLIPQLKN